MDVCNKSWPIFGGSFRVSFHVFVADSWGSSQTLQGVGSQNPMGQTMFLKWNWPVCHYMSTKLFFWFAESLILIDISMSWICLRWFFPFYHGKSLLNHHLGEYFWNFFQALKMQIQDGPLGFFVDVGQFWSQGRMVRDCGVHSENLDLWGSLRWNAGLLSRLGMDLDGRRWNFCCSLAVLPRFCRGERMIWSQGMMYIIFLFSC